MLFFVYIIVQENHQNCMKFSCCYWKLLHPQEGKLYQKYMLPFIPAEGVNSRNMETCFDIGRKRSQIRRLVDDTNNVIYCHCA